MTLNRAFVKELTALNGDGTREARTKFMAVARRCRYDLSTPMNLHGNFDDRVQQYGRAMVAVCTAATLIDNEAVSDDAREWAHEVLRHFTNYSELDAIAFNDGLNRSRIDGYTRTFRECTMK